MELQWWITVIEVPVLAGLFWMLITGRATRERQVEALHAELSAFKLHVATTYASIGHLKEVEARLTAHLLKIETKLDRVIEGRYGHDGEDARHDR
jgi:hypothetical protein